MIILRNKNYSESRKEVWEREKKEETKRNEERDHLLKKLPKKDQEHAAKMWKDTDTAGRVAAAAIDRDHALLGAGAGYLAARAGKAIAKKAGKTVKRGGLITAGSALLGSEIATRAGYKKSERRCQDIWNEGDKRQMDFIKADKKTREKMKKDYKPISPLWRKKTKK
jgi:hypothetical protein